MVGSGPGSECAKSWRFGRGGIVFELNPETKLANGSETVTHSRSTNPLTPRRDAPTRNGRQTENASHPSETDSRRNQSGLSRCAASEGAAHPSETDSNLNQSGISRWAVRDCLSPEPVGNQSGISRCAASESALRSWSARLVRSHTDRGLYCSPFPHHHTHAISQPSTGEDVIHQIPRAQLGGRFVGVSLDHLYPPPPV